MRGSLRKKEEAVRNKVGDLVTEKKNEFANAKHMVITKVNNTYHVSSLCLLVCSFLVSGIIFKVAEDTKFHRLRHPRITRSRQLAGWCYAGHEGSCSGDRCEG